MPVLKPLGEHELFLFFLQFTLLLLVARTMGEVAVRFRLPSVVGELLGGFVLGPSLLGALAPGLFDTIFPQSAEQFHLLEIVSWLGVVMLLVLTGLETDVGLIAKKGKGAAAISLGGVVVPFATGITLGFLLPETFLAAPDKRPVFALFLGTAMSISAIPVIAKVLMEMKIIRRDIGQVTLAAGMIDDTIGWILLSVVAGLAASGSIDLGTAGGSILSVLLVLVLAFTVGRRFVSFVIRTLDNLVGGDTIKITALMLLALGFGTVTHGLGLEAVLGAFLAGILVGQVKRFDDRLRHIFEQVALGVFAPVFFAASGLRVDLAKLFKPDVLLVGLIVLAVAIGGKFVGAYVGARATRLGPLGGAVAGGGHERPGRHGDHRGHHRPQPRHPHPRDVQHHPDGRHRDLPDGPAAAAVDPRPRRDRRRGPGAPGGRGAAQAELRRQSQAGPAAHGRRAGGRARGPVGAAHGGRRRRRGHKPLLAGRAPRRPCLGDRADREGREPARQRAEAGAQPRRRPGLGDPGRGGEGLRPAGHGVTDPDQARPEPHVRGVGRGRDPAVALPIVGRQLAGRRRRRRRPRRGPRRILVPVAGSPHDRHAAEVAFSFARENGTVVELLHLVSAPQHALRLGSDAAVNHAVELGHDLVEGLAELGRSLGTEVETDVVVSDHPEVAIVERAVRGADLVVVSSNRRAVTQRAFFGHRIDHILCNAPCPVVVVSSN